MLRLPIEIQAVARRKRRMLEAAQRLNDLRVSAGQSSGTLKGARVGQHSIRINDEWRICFVCARASAPGAKSTITEPRESCASSPISILVKRFCRNF